MADNLMQLQRQAARRVQQMQEHFPTGTGGTPKRVRAACLPQRGITPRPAPSGGGAVVVTGACPADDAVRRQNGTHAGAAVSGVMMRQRRAVEVAKRHERQ